MLIIKQKQKISKILKRIWMKPWLKTRSDRSACVNIILELLLTTNSGIILKGMQLHTIDQTLYIHFTYWLLIHFTLLIITILTQPLEQNWETTAGDVLEIFANFTGKHLCWGLSFTKLQVFRQQHYYKETHAQIISCQIWEILQNTYFEGDLKDCFCILITSSYINF